MFVYLHFVFVDARAVIAATLGGQIFVDDERYPDSMSLITGVPKQVFC